MNFSVLLQIPFYLSPPSPHNGPLLEIGNSSFDSWDSIKLLLHITISEFLSFTERSEKFSMDII